MDSLYFFSLLLLLLDSFSLHVSSRYVYLPCCCSSCWHKILVKNKLVFYYSPSHNFQKNLTKTKFFSSETSSSFSFFYSLPFAKSIYAIKTPFLLVLSFKFFSLKNSSVFLKWISLETKHVFVFFFLTSFSSVLFSSLLVFVHHVLHSPPFSFPFLFDLLFSWSPSSWTQFFWTISLLYQKNFSIYRFLHACVTSVCPFAHGFVHLLSLSLRVFSFLTHLFPFSFCLLCP